MDEIMELSRVYVRVDAQNRIVQIEGEYSLTNLGDLTAPNIHLIDKGNGDRYSHAQNAYLEDGLSTEDGIPRWKLVDGAPVLRTDAEIEADRAAIPEPGPSQLDRVEAQSTYTAMMTDTLLEV